MMSKLILGFLLLLSSAGCEGKPPTAVPSPEKTPWEFPEPQIELLSSPDDRVRVLAAHNLGRMGARAEAAISELEKMLEDKNPRVRDIAEESLEKIHAEISGGGSD